MDGEGMPITVLRLKERHSGRGLGGPKLSELAVERSKVISRQVRWCRYSIE